MPIYEYQCRACGNALEKIQKFSDQPLKDCPACGKPALEKKVSASAFRLKGGGWYETDFKTGSNKKNLVGGSGESDSKSPASGKAETPAASSSGSAAGSSE